MLKKLFQEPLLSFALIGAAFFVIFSFADDSDRNNRIVIDQYDAEEIISKWKLQWNRLPTSNEFKGILDNHIKQEIYYREALALNLDHNDEIIKRRMAQKMQFLAQSVTATVDPSNEELIAFMDAHKEDYMTEKKITFHQVLFSNDLRENPEKDAEIALLNEKIIGDSGPVKSIFILESFYQIRRHLGLEFATALDSVKQIQSWIGPVKSSFGFHLVQIEQIVPGEPIPFEEVRQKVKEAYLYDLEQKFNENLMKSLLKKYQVVLDFDESTIQ